MQPDLDRIEWLFCILIAFVAFCTYLILEELARAQMRVSIGIAERPVSMPAGPPIVEGKTDG